MANLKGISVEGFRVFEENTAFDFAPITILTGPNSSGKSSVFKLLMLLAENITSESGFKHLQAENKVHKLGLPDTYLNDSDCDILFSLKWDLDDDNLAKKYGMTSLDFGIQYEYIDRLIYNVPLYRCWGINSGDENLINFFRHDGASYIGSGLDTEPTAQRGELGFNWKVILARDKALFDTWRKAIVLNLKAFLPFCNENKLFEIANLVIESVFRKIQLRKEWYGNIFQHPYKLGYSPNDILGSKGRETDSQYEEYDALDPKHLSEEENRDHEMMRGRFPLTVPEYICQTYGSRWIEEQLDGLWDIFSALRRTTIDQIIPVQEIEEYITGTAQEVFNSIFSIVYHPITLHFIEAHRSESKRLFNTSDENSLLSKLLNQYRKATIHGQKEDFVDYWVQKFKIGKGFKVNLIEGEANQAVLLKEAKGVSSKKEEKDIEMNLADVGFGISQLLPIFLKIAFFLPNKHKHLRDLPEDYLREKGIDIGNPKPLKNEFEKEFVYDTFYLSYDRESQEEVISKYKNYKPKNSWYTDKTRREGPEVVYRKKVELPNSSSNLFLIEEPETNLHPKLQSQLADLFMDAAYQFDSTFLIETHSEYLIRKLQYLVATKKLRPQDVAIYYLHDPNEVPEGRKQVERINIQEDGLLDNEFGTGFFDEATKLMTSILTGESLN